MNMFFIISLMLLTQHLTSIQGELIKDPSLKPANPFIKSDDAACLKKEIHDDDFMDHDKVANIIFHRTLGQRWEISEYYAGYFAYRSRRYGGIVYPVSLQSDLVLYSTDSLTKLYDMMFTSFEQLLRTTLHAAISGGWKEKGVVEEIVCANDSEMKDVMEKYYELAYQCTIDEHLKLFHKDDAPYQEVIHKYCWPSRSQEKKLKPEETDKEAKSLQDIDIGKDKEGFKKKLKEFLDKYSEPDLKEIFNKYKKDDHRISDGVDEAFEGDEKLAFNTLVRYIENTCMYYADELYHAIDGCGTDIDKINRIIVTRSERDLMCILNEYKNKRGKTFTEHLDGDTTEDRYLESIRNLCGKK